MYKPDYNRLFWGFLLVIFNFRIQGFDILPDVIGYILIIKALQGLAHQHEDYGKGISFAVMLAVLSLVNVYQAQTGIQSSKPVSFLDYALLLLGQIGLILELFLVYWILRAMTELANETSNFLLHDQAKLRWKLNLWLTVIMLLVLPFTLNLPELMRCSKCWTNTFLDITTNR